MGRVVRPTPTPLSPGRVVPALVASTKSGGKRRSEMKICGSERDRNQWPSRYCGGSGAGSGSQHPAPHAKP